MGDDARQSTSNKELYRFGVMAIFRGYVTLGQILQEKGWITEEQEQSILKDMFGKQ